MHSESDLYGPTHATKQLARLGLAIVALWALCLVGMAALGGSAARGEEPPAKAVEKAFDKAAACKVVDDAFKKAARKDAPAPKPASKAVEDAFEAAKAKKQPDPKAPAAPERLPMPRQVAVIEPWYIDCPAACEECSGSCRCTDCVCESVTVKTPRPDTKLAQRDFDSRLAKLESSVSKLVVLMEGGQKPVPTSGGSEKSTTCNAADYRWIPDSPPSGQAMLSNWMAGDHTLMCGDKRCGSLRGNGWYFSAPDDLMAEPPIPRPNGIRTPIAGEVYPEKNGYGTRWQIGRKINPPPLPGQPGYENFGYQMTAARTASASVDDGLAEAKRLSGVPADATPSYTVGVFNAGTGQTSQVPVYHMKADGTVDHNVQPCNRPLRPNPVEYSVPVGSGSASVGAVPNRTNAPMDHTHTCPRCRYTWNHSEDGGSHHCPKCGTFQNIQDTGRRTISAYTPSRLQGRPVTGHMPVTGSYISGGCASGNCSSGGCASGNCGLPTYFSGTRIMPQSSMVGGCANGNCAAPQSVSVPYTFAVSPCQNGNCPKK